MTNKIMLHSQARGEWVIALNNIDYWKNNKL